MSKISRFILRSVLVAAVLVVVAFLYVNHAVTAFHHKHIEAALSDASGFLVSSAQPFDLTVGEFVVFAANDLRVDHPDWPNAEALVQVDELAVSLETGALVSGNVVINWMEINGVRVHLQQADDRVPNWSSGDKSESEDTADLTLPLVLSNLSVQMTEAGSTSWVLESDMLANISITIAGKAPDIDIDLDATSFEISLPENRNADRAAAESPGQVFSDDPVDLSVLDDFNLNADLDINGIVLNEEPMGWLTTIFQIADGALRVEQMQLAGEDASVAGTFAVQPMDDAYQLSLSTQLQNWRSEFLAIDGGDVDSIPPFNGELELTGSGNSVHAIMASANGRISGRHSSGAVDLQAAGPLFSDVASGLIETLNPLAESSSQTALDCGVYEINISDGLASVEQFSVQTDKLTVISSGEIDLGSEAIDMALRTKSREGLGLSIGSVATSFFRLGGTLSEPSVDVDAGGTVTTAGAAVATGGLSVLAKGLWDRLSAEADLCQPTQAEPPEEEPNES